MFQYIAFQNSGIVGSISPHQSYIVTGIYDITCVFVSLFIKIYHKYWKKEIVSYLNHKSFLFGEHGTVVGRQLNGMLSNKHLNVSLM